MSEKLQDTSYKLQVSGETPLLQWSQRQIEDVLDTMKDNAKQLYETISTQQKKGSPIKIASLEDAVNMINICYGMGLGYDHVYRKCKEMETSPESDFHTAP